MVEFAQVPKFRAVVVEDHEFQRQMSARLLRTCGAGEVIQAADGAEAIAIIDHETAPIDILLCDLQMPGIDGLEFLRHIAERRLPCSIILASALQLSIIRAAEAMAETYGLRIIGAVEKPLTDSKLLPLVLRHFSHRLATPRSRLEPMPVEEIRTGMRRGEFVPYYQPKVNMRGATLAGAEMLVRWHHPELGVVPPGAFIPVMEQHGLISDATLQLTEAVLRDCLQWRDQYLDVPIAINASAVSLQDSRLLDRIVDLASSAGVASHFITVEITESAAMNDLGSALEALTRFRMQGFGLSIDDYGTGFSSMQQLARIPFTELKIDQSFVTGAAKQQVLQALVETSAMMAKRLNLKSVAEGIETSDDWNLVARLGCDVAQGYFIGRPMPAAKFPLWCSSWRPAGGAVLPLMETVTEELASD